MNESEYTAEQIQSLHDEAVSQLRQTADDVNELRKFDIVPIEEELATQPDLVAEVVAKVRAAYETWINDDSDALFCHQLQDCQEFSQPGAMESCFWWMIYEYERLGTRCGNSSTLESFPSRTMLQASAYDPSFRLAATNSLSVNGWEMPKRSFRLAFDAADHFANSWDVFLDKYAGMGIGQLFEFNADNLEFAECLLKSWKMDIQDANDVLIPCTEVELLAELIQYEAAWLLHAYCGYPEPIRRRESGVVWVTMPCGPSQMAPVTTVNTNAKDGGEPLEMSKFRTSKEWRDLFGKVGLPASKRTWARRLKKYKPTQNGRAYAFTRLICDELELVLPEFATK